MSGNIGFAIIFLLGLGFGVIYLGLLFHFGHWRSWYLAPDTIFGARPGLYGFIPIGVAVLCMAGTIFLPGEMRGISFYLFMGLCILAVFLTFWQPRWLKPKWIYWLEENNADILDLIIEEGRKTKDWGEVVGTQEGLETWVAQVRQKHGVPASTTLPAREQDKSWFHHNWPIGLVIIVVSSAAGQYLLSNGLIGFIIGWATISFVYLLQPVE